MILAVALWNHCSKDHDQIIPLTITSLSPTEGPVGTTVTITGTGFSTTTSTVMFNDVPATVALATDKQLTVTVPPSATTGAVKVSTGGREVTGPVFTVTVTPQPIHSIQVTGISPMSGFVGTEVTITGLGFSTNASENIVKFKGTSGRNDISAVVKSATATQLIVIVPANAATGPVSVGFGNHSVIAWDLVFTVLPSDGPTLSAVAPTSGTAGTAVTLTGTGFSATPSQNIVKFNGIEATVTNATTTTLTVTVPAEATSGDVTVTVNGRTSPGIHFDVTAALTITNYTPTTGTAGTAVIIAGSGFGTDPTAITVKFNGVTAQVFESAETWLKTSVPVGATTGTITVGVGANVAEGPAFTVIGTTIAVTVSTVSLGSGTLNQPQGLAIDASNNLLISDNGNNRIVKLTSSGLELFAGSGTRSYNGGIDGLYIAAQFALPGGLSFDKNTGDVYVADTYNNSIRKITTINSLRTVKTWAGNTNGNGDFSDGQGAGPYATGAAGFYLPTGIVKSQNSATWFITDNWTHIIRKMDDVANVTTIAGAHLQTGFINGQGSAALFNQPGGIAIDENDNLYIGDCVNGAIRKIDSSGNVTTYATGVGYVFGLVWAGGGNLYAASSTNHQIYKIDSSGTVTTIAGSTRGSDNGNGTTAKFNSPWGLALDGSGNLYVSDSGNNLIRKITF
jgi:hypothetical protein